MPFAGWLTALLLGLEIAVRIGLSVRVIMRRLPTGVTASWLVLILFVPIAGAVAYLLVGESRIGHRRYMRERNVHPEYASYLRRLRARTRHIPPDLSHVDARLAREVEVSSGLPVLGGNKVTFIQEPGELFQRLVEEIDRAERSVMLEFFIWHPEGRVRLVADALARAADRGVQIRLLVDAVGSRSFIRCPQHQELTRRGVKIAVALPAHIGRTPIFRRIDHRNHRKLVVVDDRIAIMGSMNMADPDCFKTGAGVGKWIDLMCTVEGPTVELFSLLLVRDWELETDENLADLRSVLETGAATEAGPVALQAVPSGPGVAAGSVHALVLSAIYAAENELIITTPYFVPDQPIVTALQSAARRGVDVTIIVPRRSDTVLTHFAGRAFFDDLLAEGIRIAEFDGGLLHTKSITVDDELALYGTVNIDPRSFWLNFELTTIAYDDDIVAQLREIQRGYLESCRVIERDRWQERPFTRRLASNIAQLFAPLL